LEHPVKPQTKAVLALLRLNGDVGVTALDALDAVASFRLGARIWELKQAGYAIETDTVTTAAGARIARYRLADEAVQLRLPVAS
jgi:hypothetical protein